jgi:hypothetical protein
MTSTELTAFRLEPELLKGLRAIKARDGIAISDQVRQAIHDWLKHNHAAPGEVDRLFDDFESAMTATSNRRGDLNRLRLSAGFGRRMGGRLFGSLNAADMDQLDGFAQAVGRKTKAHRDFWKKAIAQERERELERNTAMDQMSDDEIRRELFQAVVERFRREQYRDVTLTVEDHPPVLSVLSTHSGGLLELGLGPKPRLISGQITWPRSRDEDQPFRFTVSRSVDRKRLVMRPGPEGEFGIVVEDIVRTFLRQM